MQIECFREALQVSCGSVLPISSAQKHQDLNAHTKYLEQELSPSSSVQTPNSHAPTPTSGNPNPPLSARESNHPTPTATAGTKPGYKKKKADKEDEEAETRGPKRLKMTYARGGVGD